ncbi:MAG: MFS transporter [Thermoflavifilum sp.]|nr:MFS transporter [Thermoflavifilum sp.]
MAHFTQHETIHTDASTRFHKRRAVRFILFLGIISLFADMTYEAARGINGPYLEILGASATVVGVFTGLGELIGYGLRLLSGYISDRSHRYWLVMYLGYGINLISVPLLAWVGHWQWAVVLILAERAGKAIRNPTRDAMLSYAASTTGQGWGFGLHELMDQIGATIGPLLMSLILWWRADDYHHAYLMLFIPAGIALIILFLANRSYPHPQQLEINVVHLEEKQRFAPGFWLYTIAAMCLAAGYADFPLIAYHFKQDHLLADAWIPVLYALSMLTEGLTSLWLGRLFDRLGIGVLIGITLLSLCFPPLVFLLPLPWIIVGVFCWGLGMGAQSSVLKAVVAQLIPQDRRATAFGLFDTMFGVAWFAGSSFMGYLYDHSVGLLVAFSMIFQLITILLLSIYLMKYTWKQSRR